MLSLFSAPPDFNAGCAEGEALRAWRLADAAVFRDLAKLDRQPV
jgi:hypothetical protein